MQGMRNILLFVSKLILILSVVGLVISFSVNSFISKGIASIFFYNFFKADIFEDYKIDDEKIKVIVELEDSKKLIANYSNIIFDDKVDVDNIDINVDMLNFIKNNEDTIEKIIGQDISISDITNYVENDEVNTITEAYKTIIVEIKEEIPDDVSELEFLFNNNFRIVLVVMSIIGLIFTILLQWSSYMFLKTLGNTLIWSGLSVIILNGLGSIYINGILSRINCGFNVDFTNNLFVSLILVVIGIIFLSVYVFIVKFIHKKKYEEERLYYSQIKRDQN